MLTLFSLAILRTAGVASFLSNSWKPSPALAKVDEAEDADSELLADEADGAGLLSSSSSPWLSSDSMSTRG